MIVWGNQCSEASLEDRAASKGVRPGSASRFPNSIPDMNTSKVNSEEIVDTMVSQKVIPRRSCGAANGPISSTSLKTSSGSFRAVSRNVASVAMWRSGNHP